ncbi:MAG TPA: tRNA-specific adenosine deaminase [Bacteroidetes bacterium]|nr:tRNA-specific adenosine deaminase [Bacteroidota bacterium]
MENRLSDEYFMQQALKLAQRAFDEDEIPVGALVVCDNKIIGKGYNQTERLNDVTAHAEMLALTAAFSALNSKYLKECTLYVTLEPCVMCAGALYWSQISRVVFGAFDEKRGYQQVKPNLLHPKTELINGVLAAESERLLKEFFANKRK